MPVLCSAHDTSRSPLSTHRDRCDRAMDRSRVSWRTASITEEITSSPPHAQHIRRFATMHECLGANLHQQRCRYRPTKNERLACGQAGELVEVSLADHIRCTRDKALIIWVFQSHNDQRIALGGHVRIEL